MFHMVPGCQYMKKNGELCQREALTGYNYCKQHTNMFLKKMGKAPLPKSKTKRTKKRSKQQTINPLQFQAPLSPFGMQQPLSPFEMYQQPLSPFGMQQQFQAPLVRQQQMFPFGIQQQMFPFGIQQQNTPQVQNTPKELLNPCYKLLSMDSQSKNLMRPAIVQLVQKHIKSDFSEYPIETICQVIINNSGQHPEMLQELNQIIEIHQGKI